MDRECFVRVLVAFLLLKGEIATGYEEKTGEYTLAYLNISYKDVRGRLYHIGEHGRYGKFGPFKPAEGYIVHIPDYDWCKPHTVKSMNQPWIALIPRGNCTSKEKILFAKQNNASAVIIYNHDKGDFTMEYQGTGNIVAVSITEKLGNILASLVNSKTSVFVEIAVGTRFVEKPSGSWHVSRTSVLFVLVSFILLMCISLAWLVFYYVQRFRYFYARDRKEKLLLSAAKKAVSKLATKHYTESKNKDHEETCAVCLENYKDGEILRVLTCRHDFHKHCVDPWLLEHRTCPMCKMNILKALGVEIPGAGIDVESSDDHGLGMETVSEPVTVQEASLPGQYLTGVIPTQESEGASATTPRSIQVVSTDGGERPNDMSRSTVALVTTPAM